MKVPILLYHRLFCEKLDTHKYSIGRKEFKKQIKYLSENGFQSLLIENLDKSLKYFSPDRKPIVITFDDGNYSDYSIAIPILQKYGFVATFFVTVNWIGDQNFLQWSHLKEMYAVGMSVQSHSLTHSFLSDLKPNKLYKEIVKSKKIIEKRLNSRVNFFSLPGGFFSTKALNVLKNANYAGLCTSVPGLNILKPQQKELIIFNRFLISRKTSFQNYKAIVNGSTNTIAFCKAEHYLKETAKKLLGSKKYYFIWAHLHRDI